MDEKVKKYLIKYGFREVGKQRPDKTGIDKDWKLFVRIHVMTWAWIDGNDFVTLITNSDTKKRDQKITLPRPIRTIKNAEALLHIFDFI